jgi:hypothetical protein
LQYVKVYQTIANDIIYYQKVAYLYMTVKKLG